MRLTKPTPFPGCFGMRDSIAQLCRQRRQQRLIRIAETTRLALTDQQHTEHFFLVNDRYAERTPVLPFTGLQQEILVQIGRYLFEVQWAT